MKHTIDNSTTFYGDNRELLKRFHDGMIDWAVDDPPYFSGPERRRFYGKKVSKIGNLLVNRIDYPVTNHWQIPDKEYFQLLQSKTRNQIIWGANYFDFGLWEPHKTPRRNELDKWLSDHPTGWIIWDKLNTSQFNDFELAWTSTDKPTQVFTFMWNGMMQGKSMNEGHIMQGNKKLNEKKIHPTQKPTALYHWVYLNYLNEKQIVVDPHCGSQTSRIAAYDIGIPYIGMEKEIIHFDNGNHRFETYVKSKKQQLTLFQ